MYSKRSLMRRTTIKDIAALLSVSPSTVSRALDNNPEISEETRLKVHEAAEQLNYTKNLNARRFRNNKSGLLALILPEINMYFIPELIQGVQTTAEQHGMSVIILQSDNSLQREEELLRYCLSLSVEGILMSIGEESDDDRHVQEIVGDLIPLVMIDNVIPSQHFSSVSINDYNASFEAVTHLLDAGHTEIAGIFGNPAQPISSKRKSGFFDAFKQRGISVNKDLIVNVPGILSFEQLLSPVFSKKNFTAVFCMSDELLMQAYYLLVKTGLKIPDDCSLIAISDGIMPYNLYPNISHIHHSGYEIGAEGMNVLVRLMNGTKKFECLEMGTTLYEMDSVARLN